MRSTHRSVNSSVRDRCRTVDGLVARAGWYDALALILKLLELVHAFTQLPLSLLFLDGTLTDCVHSLPVYEITRSWTSCKFTIDSFPVLFEIRLNVLQSVKSRHLTRLFGWWCLAATLASRLSLCRHLGRMRRLRLLHTTRLALAHYLSVLRRIL